MVARCLKGFEMRFNIGKWKEVVNRLCLALYLKWTQRLFDAYVETMLAVLPHVRGEERYRLRKVLMVYMITRMHAVRELWR